MKHYPQSSKSYITALSFAHKVTRLTPQSELNLSVSLIYLKLTLKLISYTYTWGTETIPVGGTGTILVPSTGTVLVFLMPVLSILH